MYSNKIKSLITKSLFVAILGFLGCESHQINTEVALLENFNTNKNTFLTIIEFLQTNPAIYRIDRNHVLANSKFKAKDDDIANIRRLMSSVNVSVADRIGSEIRLNYISKGSSDQIGYSFSKVSPGRTVSTIGGIKCEKQFMLYRQVEPFWYLFVACEPD